MGYGGLARRTKEEISMKKLLLALGLSAFLPACTDEEGTRRALDDAGFTQVSVGGYGGLGCGLGLGQGGDTFCTEFMATNPAGKRVHGVVGCGVFKNCTIRF
jgi:hypothetical protein